MAEIYTIKHETLKGIADAIRAKTGATDPIAVTDMASQIEGITGGGAGGDSHTVTFMSEDGTTKLYEKQVTEHNTCANPVSLGLIDIPTKASTAQYNYSFSGWATTQGGAADDNALVNITGDKTVYVAFKETVRKYTANFYDGTTLLKTEQVEYGAQATPPDTTKDGHNFVGWSPSNLTITTDTDFVGSWKAYTVVNFMYQQTISMTESTIYDNCWECKKSAYDWTPSVGLPTIGETYIVEWDGVPYECVCNNISYKRKLGSDWVNAVAQYAFGNIRQRTNANHNYSSVPVTNEPFFINREGQTDNNFNIFTTDESATHTIKIYQIK